MQDRAPSKPKSIAKMIDHSLVHPTLTDQDMARGCEVGKRYGVAAPPVLLPVLLFADSRSIKS